MKRRPNIKAAGFITKIKVLFTVRDFVQRAQSQNIMIFALTSLTSLISVTHCMGNKQILPMHLLVKFCLCVQPGFFPGGLGVPSSGENFANPPIRHLSPFLDQGLSNPPPADVRPRKFEKFKYIFVSNLTTFKLKSTLKSCISCFK